MHDNVDTPELAAGALRELNGTRRRDGGLPRTRREAVSP
jgi:hypothetical protein